MVFYYNPENIEIVRILPSTSNGTATSKIEYNKIILEIENPIFSSSTETLSFFQLYFKSNIVGKEAFTLGTGSEAVTTNKTYPLQGDFALDFAKVPECEPDIVPPSISLIYPKNTNDRITLDQYFIFDIKDIGKGVDKNSVIINFDGEQYFYGSENLKRNGNYLTFYPSTWIPIDTGMDLKILITDKQSYGGANKTESTYNFHTATGMALNKMISPIMFRRMSQEAGNIGGSADECTLLASYYTRAEVRYQYNLKSIIQKLGCSLNTMDESSESNEDIVPQMNAQQKQYRNISVFATLGWILFFIAFTLKIHYLLAYRKHKKLNEQ
ncbi:TPA: hypothetical protein DCZ39_01085 [Patescibacteria group bacterium]|nr:hypothetical protein [Candidatus Gracilibacteria bacterium]